MDDDGDFCEELEELENLKKQKQNAFKQGLLRTLKSAGDIDNVMEEIVPFFLNEVQPQLDEFARLHGEKFAEVPDDPSEIEKNLDHWSLFQEYVQIFEGKISGLLKDKGIPIAAFVNKIKQGEEIRQLGAEVPAGKFVDLLRTVDDFAGFLLFMRDSHSSYSPPAPVPPTDQPPPQPAEAEAEAADPVDWELMSASATYFLHVVQPKLSQFVIDHSKQFVQEETGGAEGEHSNEQYALYKEYIAIFEENMTNFLTARMRVMRSYADVAVKSFVKNCKLAEQAKKKAQPAETEGSDDVGFLELICAIENYDEWLAYMRMGSKWVNAGVGVDLD